MFILHLSPVMTQSSKNTTNDKYILESTWMFVKEFLAYPSYEAPTKLTVSTSSSPSLDSTPILPHFLAFRLDPRMGPAVPARSRAF